MTKPAPLRALRITVKAHTWDNLSYDDALVRLRKLIDAGLCYVSCDMVPDASEAKH